jgi:hypothetical protein
MQEFHSFTLPETPSHEGKGAICQFEIAFPEYYV